MEENLAFRAIAARLWKRLLANWLLTVLSFDFHEARPSASSSCRFACTTAPCNMQEPYDRNPQYSVEIARLQAASHGVTRVGAILYYVMLMLTHNTGILILGVRKWMCWLFPFN